MTIDLKELKTIPLSGKERLEADEKALVIIKIQENYSLPHYVKVRGYISKHILTAEVDAYVFNQLIAEPGVIVEVSKRMKVIA